MVHATDKAGEDTTVFMFVHEAMIISLAAGNVRSFDEGNQ